MSYVRYFPLLIIRSLGMCGCDGGVSEEEVAQYIRGGLHILVGRMGGLGREEYLVVEV